MHRTPQIDRRLIWLVAFSLAIFAHAVPRGLAEDKAKAVPAGLRVFYTGHSFHMFVEPRIEQLVKSAGIEGHRLIGKQGIGGSRVIQHWELGDGKNRARSVLTNGEIDVFTMAAHLAIPDPGIDYFTELGLQHNPKLRLLVQASWMPYDLVAPEKRIRDNSERDDIDLEKLEVATNAWRVKLEMQVENLNRSRSEPAIFIVPVGNAVNKLRRQIVDGKFPGLARQSELFRDPIGHGLGHVQSLVSYCNFAAIYRYSPVGLQLNEPGVSTEQHSILQQIAWETVSNYAYSGIPK